MTTMTVTPLSAQDVKLPEFARWLANTESEWFLEYLSPNHETSARYLQSRFENALAGPGGQAFRFTEGERTLGAIAMERLDWDSKHFGIECGRVAVSCIARGLDSDRQQSLYTQMLEEALNWAEANNIRLLQRRLLFDKELEKGCLIDLALKKDLDIHVADNMVTLWRPLVAHSFALTERKNKGLAFRPTEVKDLPALLEMTRGAFPDSRFVRDLRLKAAGGEEVYQRWIENLLRNRSSDKTPAGTRTNVLVCVVGATVVGYAAYRTDPALDSLLGRRLGMLDLIVVEKTYRGQGIGRELLIHTMETMQKSGISDVEATTWMNLRSDAFYQREGLQGKAHLLTYHLWLS